MQFEMCYLITYTMQIYILYSVSMQNIILDILSASYKSYFILYSLKEISYNMKCKI